MGSRPAAWTSVGDDQQFANFGQVVASAGDTNGDGRDEVLIGVPDFRDFSATETGKAYLFCIAP